MSTVNLSVRASVRANGNASRAERLRPEFLLMEGKPFQFPVKHDCIFMGAQAQSYHWLRGRVSMRIASRHPWLSSR